MIKPLEFDLDTATKEWRENLGQAPQFRAENLDELEAHLRDSVAVLQDRGLSVEEAFFVAAHRLGSAAALAPEYSKVNATEVWLNRLIWMLAGIQLWALIGAVSKLLSATGNQLLIIGMFRAGYQVVSGDRITFGSVAVPAVLFGLIHLLALLSVAAGAWWLIRRNAGRWSQAVRRRGWLMAGAVALCLVPVATEMAASLAYIVRVKALGTQSNSLSVAYAMAYTHIVFQYVIAVVLAVITVRLVRRQLRPASGP